MRSPKLRWSKIDFHPREIKQIHWQDGDRELTKETDSRTQLPLHISLTISSILPSRISRILKKRSTFLSRKLKTSTSYTNGILSFNFVHLKTLIKNCRSTNVKTIHTNTIISNPTFQSLTLWKDLGINTN